MTGYLQRQDERDLVEAFIDKSGPTHRLRRMELKVILLQGIEETEDERGRGNAFINIPITLRRNIFGSDNRYPSKLELRCHLR